MARSKSLKKNSAAVEAIPAPSAASPAPVNPKVEAATAAVAATADKKTETKKPESKILALVKSDSRTAQLPTAPVSSNLVPINLDDEVRRLAYLLAERRGFAPGHDAEDWLTAESEIRQRYHQQSA